MALVAAQREPWRLLSNRPPSHPEIEVSSVIASGCSSRGDCVARAPLTIVAILVNNAEQSMNVSGVLGSINDVSNGMYYQNFSAKAVTEAVAPGSELAISYTVRPEMYEAMSVQLSAVVFYSGANRGEFSTVIFNETVLFVAPPPPGGVVMQVLPYVLAGIVTLGMIAFVWPIIGGPLLEAVGLKGGKGKRASGRKPSSEERTGFGGLLASAHGKQN